MSPCSLEIQIATARERRATAFSRLGTVAPKGVLLNRCLWLAGLLLLTIPSPSSAFDDGPAVGVHTIRADDGLLQQAAESGFSWLIQLLPWREVEPVLGEPFWEAPDWLVRAAGYYGLDLVLRLDGPPAWAFSRNGAPGVDVPAYAAFVGRVAARYRGRVAAYVIWNEPNLSAEWGGMPPDPAGYVELLCAAHAAIRQADPQAQIVSAGLAPTNHVNATAVDDRRYLEAMYDAGAAACFDVLGVHPYGFAYPPDDPPGAHDALNLSRLAELRAIMVERGDAHKPVWATELGWTTDPIGSETQWLRVSEEERGLYLVGAIERARREWPWLEKIAVWNLSTGLPTDDEKRGYSILADDGTPRPALEALMAALAPPGEGRMPSEGTSGGPDVPQTVEILAPDVIVRLSDVATVYPHWARPHCRAVPCRRWTGQFYVREPGAAPWRLRMEMMQVEEPGNLVWINRHLLDPPAIPLRGRPDFASVWTRVEILVPAALLQPGVNTLEIHASPRLPVYQDDWARFESLQVRDVQLVP